MKRAIILSILLLMPAMTWAAEPEVGKRPAAPAQEPTVIDGVTYITGIAEVDEMKSDDPKRIPRYKAWFYLDKWGASLTRVDRGTWDGGSDDVELGVAYFKYPDITELYYGHDAIERAKQGLPTGLKKIRSPGRGMIFGGSSYVKLPSYMRSRNKVPMIIFFKKGGKPISLVVSGPPDEMKELYTILAKQAGLNVKPPQTYP